MLCIDFLQWLSIAVQHAAELLAGGPQPPGVLPFVLPLCFPVCFPLCCLCATVTTLTHVFNARVSKWWQTEHCYVTGHESLFLQHM